MNNAKDLISVIVPTYCRKDLLKNAVNSIFLQTYQNFEVVVINDGGKSVSDILQSFDQNKITYWEHDTRKGVSAARNTGIRASRGKYIAYLDDDDIYYPNHLEILANCLKNSKYEVAYTDACMITQVHHADNNVKICKSIPYSLDFSKDLLLVHNISPTLCFMHNKTCLSDIGFFNENFLANEDWDLWIRLSRNYEFKHINKVTAEFRRDISEKTITTTQSEEFYNSMKIIYANTLQYTKNKPLIRTAQKLQLMCMKDAIDKSYVRSKYNYSVGILPAKLLLYILKKIIH